MPEKSDLPQGTLDLLILKVVALGPVHGYAIAQRLQQVSCDSETASWERLTEAVGLILRLSEGGAK
jgi:DNA-binding PadR family transcriptional regulator